MEVLDAPTSGFPSRSSQQQQQHPPPSTLPPHARPSRRSGFSRPFHPLQVASWVLMACCVVVYFSLTVPFVPSGHTSELVSFSVLYCVIFSVGFVVYLAVSLSDPYTPTASALPQPPPSTSPLVEQPPPVPSSLDAQLPSAAPATAAATAAAGMALPVSTAATPPTLPLCPACGAVQTATTKHCYIDGRCVDGFDHHCIYLNLCVGRRNYHLFFAFVCLVTALLTLQLTVTIYLLAHFHDDPYQQAVRTVSST